MKNFFEGVLEWKSWASLTFSGAVVLYVVIAALMGQSEVPVYMIVSLLLISSVGTCIQYVAFGPRVIKNMRYTLRMLVFAVPFLGLLSATAYFFRWFPADSHLDWLGFIGIYLLVFLVMTAGFEVYFKVTGKKYDGLLGQYHKRKKP